jgi:hypothetical protein
MPSDCVVSVTISTCYGQSVVSATELAASERVSSASLRSDAQSFDHGPMRSSSRPGEAHKSEKLLHFWRDDEKEDISFENITAALQQFSPPSGPSCTAVRTFQHLCPPSGPSSMARRGTHDPRHTRVSRQPTKLQHNTETSSHESNVDQEHDHLSTWIPPSPVNVQFGDQRVRDEQPKGLSHSTSNQQLLPTKQINKASKPLETGKARETAPWKLWTPGEE